MRRFLVPLAVFALLLGVFAFGLRLDPRELPSPLVGRPAPHFNLPLLHAPDRSLSPADLRGRVWLLNVWASWCVACRQEHALMLATAATGAVPIVGLDYKDTRSDALAWLNRLGDPYLASLSDSDGLAGIDYGVYGVPETFVIDRDGVVRQRFTGPLTDARLRDEILPLVARLK